MLMIEGIDWELPQIGKEPKMGYAPEYIEKVMVGGKIKRIYKGDRFYASWSYAYLTAEQSGQLQQLLAKQSDKGYVEVVISQPYGKQGTFSGEAILEVNDSQSRFMFNSAENDYVWINWTCTLKGTEYDNR